MLLTISLLLSMPAYRDYLQEAEIAENEKDTTHPLIVIILVIGSIYFIYRIIKDESD